MKDGKKITVIVITYNMCELLKNALESLKNQICNEFEVIVVDNHSTDETESLINNFIGLDLKYCKVHNNGILSISRNQGIRLAEGEWVAFLDADDSWEPNKIAELKKIIDSNLDKEIVAISHDYLVKDIKTNKSQVYKCGSDAIDFQKDLVLKKNSLALTATMVRKDALEKIDGFSELDELKTVEDYDCWIRLAGIGKFLFVHKVLATINIHDGNYSKKADIQMNALNFLKHKYIDRDLEASYTQEEKLNAYVECDILRARLLQKNGFFELAEEICVDLLKRSVFKPKVILIYLFSVLKITR